MFLRLFLCAFAFFAFSGSMSSLTAQESLRHPLQQQNTLNSYFPFQPPRSMEEWQERRQKLRQHIQVSLGLWPMPEKTPLHAVVHGKIDMGDYTIEQVYFESFPGFFLTGNLYRPARPADQTDGGKMPGVLCPHGHFRDGRFRWANDEELKKDLDSGAEQFETNGRSPLQARCANLAMMGCVVFHYDMLGYADSQQISHGLAHGFRSQRPGMNGKDGWGFFSPQAELRLQSIMGLQTWNSIRSLDFLCSLPGVDDKRIGVTGGSGGGTQTFVLCAIDPRPTVAFPAVMVSTAMQGGCTCENCCNLRINAGNVDFAALFAPKPLGLTAADDWTKEMETKGFPELQQLYELHRATNADAPQPELTARLEFPHNYNQVSREAMYGFFKRHLKLDAATESCEREIKVHRPDTLTVFNDDHPRPDWSDGHEIRLLRHWASVCRTPAESSELKNEEQLDRFHAVQTVALRSIISHPDSNLEFKEVSSERIDRADRRQCRLITGVIKANDVGLESKLAMFVADLRTPPDSIMLRVDNTPLKKTRQLLKFDTRESELVDGGVVLAQLTIGDPVENNLVPNGREAAGYTFGYNRSVFTWRVSEVLYAIEILAKRFPEAQIKVQSVDPDFAPVAAMAFAATDNDAVKGLHCHLDGFRFVNVETLQDANFLPGGARYGDIPGFLATKYDREITLVGESKESCELLMRVMKSRGFGDRLKLTSAVE